jgi:hypothetical protein
LREKKVLSKKRKEEKMERLRIWAGVIVLLAIFGSGCAKPPKPGTVAWHEENKALEKKHDQLAREREQWCLQSADFKTRVHYNQRGTYGVEATKGLATPENLNDCLAHRAGRR